MMPNAVRNPKALIMSPKSDGSFLVSALFNLYRASPSLLVN